MKNASSYAAYRKVMGKRDAGSDAPAKVISFLLWNDPRGRSNAAPALLTEEPPMIYALIAAALVAVDQIVKYLVMTNIAPGEHVPFIPYILDLTYVTNTGAAFSIFSEHTWALALVSLVMSVVLALALWKGLFRHPLGRLTLTLLLAGAVGNLIDRAFRGFVVDMFNVLFMRFAVFNVADICVVVGGIAAGVYYLFLMDRLEPREEKADDNAEAGR